jgi:hypothetical protein
MFSSICGVTVSIAATFLSYGSSKEAIGFLQTMSLMYPHRNKFIGHGNPYNNLESHYIPRKEDSNTLDATCTSIYYFAAHCHQRNS